jgi:hypothetical protein
MFANWLLPYNEMVAGWVDPWYDAGQLRTQTLWVLLVHTQSSIT